MCLITLQQKPKITKKDMVVWKVVLENNGIISSYFFREFVWEERKLMNVKLRIEEYPRDKALLCIFDTTADQYYKRFWLRGSVLRVISCGFHACKTRNRVRTIFVDFYEAKLKKFIIPKGSQYFTDGTGLIVSNRMMLVE